MRRLTPADADLTTRKAAISDVPRAKPRTQARTHVIANLALAGAMWLLAGCATPGPLHVYSIAAAGEREVVDTREGQTATVPSFLEADERISGFAYDPFTDHFFLRLEPGNRIRVVDRPARAIKREFEIVGAENSRGDLAVRPRDGHLFLAGGTPGTVIETTRLGKFLRTLTLPGIGGHPRGIAFDTAQDRLLVLTADGQRITAHDGYGAVVRQVTLEQEAGDALAFDSEKREFYAPLVERSGVVGVFDEAGKLRRTQPAAGPWVDVGPRSFVRVF